jgi:hypothetical protein
VRRVNCGRTWRNALTAFACIAATVVGACAGGDSGGYTSVEYGYGGVYYGSAWNAGWYGGGPVYVGPPAGPPPGAIGGGRPPHVSTMPVRPMPAARPAGGGGGRRR